jgi:hypothetical protein
MSPSCHHHVTISMLMLTAVTLHVLMIDVLAYSTQARNQVVLVKLRDLVISAKVGGSGGEGDSGQHGSVQDT